jgi:hypothetical protein
MLEYAGVQVQYVLMVEGIAVVTFVLLQGCLRIVPSSNTHAMDSCHPVVCVAP